jgi:hypothetical protein
MNHGDGKFGLALSAAALQPGGRLARGGLQSAARALLTARRPA